MAPHLRGMGSLGLRVLLIGLVLTLGSCALTGPRAPYVPLDAAAAMEEPCRFMGTVHRRARAQLEVLRMRHRLDMDQWRCGVTELAAIDDFFTAECRDRSVHYAEVQDEMRGRYEDCWGPAHALEVEDALDIAQ